MMASKIRANHQSAEVAVVVNADDFGKSTEINEAVLDLMRRGRRTRKSG